MTSILLVDDNPTNLDVIENILTNDNLDILFASSGIHALELLERISVDAILLDVMMPGMDGVEVCRRVKANPKWVMIPIIMVTALDSKEDLAYCLQSGADDFVTKPVNSSELRARLRSMLRIKKQYDELQELLQIRSDLTNMIIHDLRNPLTTIMLSSEILKRTPLTEKQQKKVEQIYQNGRQAIDLIDRQLLAVKIEGGHLSLTLVEVDLIVMLETVVEQLQLIADKHKVSLLAELPQPSQLTTVDENLFQRIVENLLTNAIKFSKSGQKVIIRLEYPSERKVRISVLDEGSGVSEELKEIIFNRFEVGHSFANVEQTGLGLAFCKLAIAAHGGQIWVEDNLPQGAIFIVEL